MKLKTLVILFGALLFANFLGDKTFAINLYENYYVINWMQLILAIVTFSNGGTYFDEIKKWS
ncbi:hypothetical protein [Maribacter sp. 2308TA10-17]|uniref:hypothetical protein n=1 Tax=Maribacter sp. 2308TA10-17 TaxID=3386276 RepID=UPI0039BD2CC4